MDVGPFVVPDTETSKLVEPGERALDNPTPPSQAAAVCCAAYRQQRQDATMSQRASDGRRIVRRLRTYAVKVDKGEFLSDSWHLPWRRHRTLRKFGRMFLARNLCGPPHRLGPWSTCSHYSSCWRGGVICKYYIRPACVRLALSTYRCFAVLPPGLHGAGCGGRVSQLVGLRSLTLL
jgi:hypothetical protein